MSSLVASPMVQAAKLKKQNLTQLISASESIVAGTVINVVDGIDDKIGLGSQDRRRGLGVVKAHHREDVGLRVD